MRVAKREHVISVREEREGERERGERNMTNIKIDRFYSGLDFLTRGKVVVTNRLHGHILSTLLDILSLYLFLSLLFCMVFLF